PADIPIDRVEEVSVKAPAATQLLDKAEYLITVEANFDATEADWQKWIAGILDTPEIYWEKTTKSGKKQQVNLRDRLFELSINAIDNSNPKVVELRYLGSCCNDGTILQPDQLLFMLEKVAGCEFNLIKIHRQQIILLDSVNLLQI
ncbi:MAG: TIGR03936 family radical SAM-associated protein, partial [Xenococcaceae cyanobacterium]